ncbi:MAG: PilX N-terminal domain-containing pilus assembly protein [Steroidobacter sp.]
MTAHSSNFASNRHFQSGAALIVSLIFLLIMTILALSMSQTTTLEERMAGNARDANLAFQGAESGLKSAVTYMNGISDAGPTVVSNSVDLTNQDDSWWTANGFEYGSSSQELTALNSDPHYVVKPYALNVADSPMRDGGSITTYYQMVGRSRGNSTESEAVVAEIYGHKVR